MNRSQKYRITISVYDRELILKYCLVITDDLAASIKQKRSRAGSVSIELTLNEVSEIAGWIAMEANHTKNRQLEEGLSALYENLESFEYQIKNDR
jgi:hypothetical protein